MNIYQRAEMYGTGAEEARKSRDKYISDNPSNGFMPKRKGHKRQEPPVHSQWFWSIVLGLLEFPHTSLEEAKKAAYRITKEPREGLAPRAMKPEYINLDALLGIDVPDLDEIFGPLIFEEEWAREVVEVDESKGWPIGDEITFFRCEQPEEEWEWANDW